jgi:hypothetical protein
VQARASRFCALLEGDEILHLMVPPATQMAELFAHYFTWFFANITLFFHFPDPFGFLKSEFNEGTEI